MLLSFIYTLVAMMLCEIDVLKYIYMQIETSESIHFEIIVLSQVYRFGCIDKIIILYTTYKSYFYQLRNAYL